MSFHPKMAYDATFHKSMRTLADPGPAFEFTPENRAKLDEILTRYPSNQKRSAVLPALYLVQYQQGYITGNAMRAENDDRPFRHLIQLFHKHRPFLPERIDDMAAMHDLMANIDRGAVLLERQIHNVDRPIDTGAKPTGIGKIDFHSHRRSSARALFESDRSYPV